MYFEMSITIRRSPEEVFGFLRDKHKYTQKPGSPILLLEQTTPGPAGVGTRYREVVRMAPCIRGEILSVVTHFDPGERLEEDFEGAGMAGHLAYRFVAKDGGTVLTQQETVRTRGLVRVLEPVMKCMLSRQLRKRLKTIKTVLESGRVVARQG